LKYFLGAFPFGFLPESMGVFSDEHGEMLHPGISQIEKRYSGKWSANTFADYCWSHRREKSAGENKRQKSNMRDIKWPV
jgi:hypothetical protein